MTRHEYPAAGAGTITRMRGICAAAAFTIVTVFNTHPATADHIPVARENNVEYETNLRVFLNSDEWTFFSEAKGRFRDEIGNFGYRSITAGPYYRLIRNLVLGAFYRFQQGARHDDDWIATNPGWEWRDTSSRSEHVLILDATPRVMLGENWVAEIKGRYLHNTFNEEQTATVRPGISYLVMLHGQQLFNLYAQYEVYFPLNYGVTTVYEKWFYLGALYHANEVFKVGLYGARREVIWGPSDEVKRDMPGTRYEVAYKAIEIGFILTAMIDL